MRKQVWCMSGLMRHGGKVHKQSYKLSGAQYATVHIDETPRQVIWFDLIYVPNNIKCWLTWQGVKHNKTTYLGKFKWGRKQQTTIPENPHTI